MAPKSRKLAGKIPNTVANKKGSEVGITSLEAPEESMLDTKEVYLNFGSRNSFPHVDNHNILPLQRAIGNKAVLRLLAQQAPQNRIPGANINRSTHHVCTSACNHASVQRQENQTVIQRHSSFEHKMLGDVRPEDLEIIAMANNLNKKGTAVNELGGALQITKPPYTGKTIKKDDVLHTLMQEIERIRYFRDNPIKTKNEGGFLGIGGKKVLDETPEEFRQRLINMDNQRRIKEGTESLDEAEIKKGAKNEKEADQLMAAAQKEVETQVKKDQWQLEFVTIPSKDGSAPLVVTYGEMNTLADIYGNIEEMKNADPKNRYEIMQGIRQQALFRYMELYEKVTGEHSFGRKWTGFDDAIGDTGPRGGTMVGQLRLMGKLKLGPIGFTGKETDKEENAYTASLARNACHFAPESWHSWAEYHNKARQLARDSWQSRQDAQTLRAGMTGQKDTKGQLDMISEDIADKKKKGAEFQNEALMNNGFGDHFLQDSYAAGHLINKTEIMKEFVKWLDSKPFKSDRTADEKWRQIQAIAYNQEGIGTEGGNRYDMSLLNNPKAKDAQSVENLEGDWKNRFDALGLQIPGSMQPGSQYFEFIIWWQERAAKRFNTRQMTVKNAVKESGFNEDFVIGALRALVKDSVARINWTGITPGKEQAPASDEEMKKVTFLLREDYIPDRKKFDAFLKAYHSEKPMPKQKAGDMYKRMAASVTYNNYHTFLNNTLLQAGTNVLHDYYCNNGVKVKTGVGDEIGKIYGDDAMLSKDSATGVRYSAETARRSHDNITEIIKTGAPKYSNDEIFNRFPTHVMLPDDKGNEIPVSLADWHKGALREHCMVGIKATAKDKAIKSSFQETKDSIKDIAAMLGDLTTKVSKDVHAGQAF
ncbi:hypothetical protein [Candidatus Chlorohelix sp.]|uniref:hypothetical protein n=1 Tax=Candidatus Chlorohelix sp. TaxID=3139201 RepID=UPI003050B3FC